MGSDPSPASNHYLISTKQRHFRLPVTWERKTCTRRTSLLETVRKRRKKRRFQTQTGTCGRELNKQQIYTALVISIFIRKNCEVVSSNKVRLDL